MWQSAPVVRIAQTLLIGLRITPIANDKNSGYTLLSDSDVRTVLCKILDCDRYTLINDQDLEGRRWVAQGILEGIAHRLSKALDDKSVRSSAQKYCRQPSATDVAQMQLRCTSQKPPGPVRFRVITGNPKYKYKPLSLWVAQYSRGALRQQGCDHLVLSGVDFTKRLKPVPFRKSAKLIKLGLTDFYLEGDRDTLSSTIGPGQDALDKLFLGSVQLLLRGQYASWRTSDSEMI